MTRVLTLEIQGGTGEMVDYAEASRLIETQWDEIRARKATPEAGQVTLADGTVIRWRVEETPS